MLRNSVDPGAEILAVAAAVRGRRRGELTREHQLDALGFDSLDRIALVVAVEQTIGRDVPDHVLAAAGSLGDLIGYLTGEPEGSL